jgi:hypothetical protein
MRSQLVAVTRRSAAARNGTPRRDDDFPTMEKIADPARRLSWPWWSRWALLAVAATSVFTIAATLNDIL